METPEELRNEWGDERYVCALRDLSGFYVHRDSTSVPSVEELQALGDKNKDALDLMSARLLAARPQEAPCSP